MEWLATSLDRYRIPYVDDDPVFAVRVSDPERIGPVKDFHVLYSGSLATIRTFDLSSLGRTLMHQIEGPRFAHRTDATFLRAGLLLAGGRSILVPLTVVTALDALGPLVERAGISLPAATHVAVDPSGWVVPFETSLDVPGDTRVRLEALDMGTGRRPRHEVEAPVKVDAIVTFQPRAGHGLETVGRASSLYQLTRTASNMPTVGNPGFTAVARLVAGAECYNLGNAASRETPGILASLVAGTRSVAPAPEQSGVSAAR
jgi:hypothetical protein